MLEKIDLHLGEAQRGKREGLHLDVYIQNGQEEPISLEDWIK